MGPRPALKTAGLGPIMPMGALASIGGIMNSGPACATVETTVDAEQASAVTVSNEYDFIDSSFWFDLRICAGKLGQ